MNKYCKSACFLTGVVLPLAAEPTLPVVPLARADQGFGVGLNLAAPCTRPVEQGDGPGLEAVADPEASLRPQTPAGPAAQAEATQAGLVFDDEDCVPIAPLAQVAGRFQPMIQEQEAGLVPSEHFVAMAPKLADLNRLAYHRGGLQREDPVREGGWSLPAPADWNLRNFNGARGLFLLSQDRNAGFVGYHAGSNTLVVCFHGAHTTGDWLQDLRAWAEPVNGLKESGSGKADPIARIMVGKVHSGFLHRALSCRMQIRAHVDTLLGERTPEQRAQAKFYVTGHRQGAALGQVAIGWLCQDLRRHYGPEFHNARENRVHGWFLDAPAALDPTAAAFVNGLVGKRNILVQESTLDLDLHGAGRKQGVEYRSVGTLAVQSSWDTFTRSLTHYRNRIGRTWANGTWGEFLASLVPANPFRPTVGSAHAMSDAANGADFHMDADTVVEVQADITWALQNARDREQQELRDRAAMGWGRWMRQNIGW